MITGMVVIKTRQSKLTAKLQPPPIDCQQRYVFLLQHGVEALYNHTGTWLFSYLLWLLSLPTTVNDALMTDVFDNRCNKCVSRGFALLLHIIHYDITTLVRQFTAMS